MTTLTEIATLPLPPFRANIRHLDRKERAAQVRALFKALKVTGISVTAPSYSMAQSIDIRLPALEVSDEAHVKRHAEIDDLNTYPWTGYGNNGCQHCKVRREAQVRIEQVILAAFPDLNDRYDYCLSIS